MTGSSPIIPRVLIVLAVLHEPAALQAAEEGQVTEEIIVEGSRDRINLQLQVDQAEDEFYAIFNKLIDDEDFRIECKYEKVIGSLIKQRICQTRYMRKEMTRAAAYSQMGIERLSAPQLLAKNREMRRKAVELLEKSPELRSAALNLSNRVEEYRDEYGIKNPGK